MDFMCHICRPYESNTWGRKLFEDKSDEGNEMWWLWVYGFQNRLSIYSFAACFNQAPLGEFVGKIYNYLHHKKDTDGLLHATVWYLALTS